MVMTINRLDLIYSQHSSTFINILQHLIYALLIKFNHNIYLLQQLEKVSL